MPNRYNQIYLRKRKNNGYLYKVLKIKEVTVKKIICISNQLVVFIADLKSCV